MKICGYSPYVIHSLMRGWFCRLQLLLDLASVVILGYKSCGIHDHILLSQIRDSPELLFLCIDRVVNIVSNGTSIVACISVTAGTCLPSRYLATVLVYLLISQSFHHNGSTRYSILNLGTRCNM
jgi:hypothetical protein